MYDILCRSVKYKIRHTKEIIDLKNPTLLSLVFFFLVFIHCIIYPRTDSARPQQSSSPIKPNFPFRSPLSRKYFVPLHLRPYGTLCSPKTHFKLSTHTTHYYSNAQTHIPSDLVDQFHFCLSCLSCVSCVDKALSGQPRGTSHAYEGDSPFTFELLNLMNDLKPRVPATPPLAPVDATKIRRLLGNEVGAFGKGNQQVHIYLVLG